MWSNEDVKQAVDRRGKSGILLLIIAKWSAIYVQGTIIVSLC